jgi:hypothetical protein
MQERDYQQLGTLNGTEVGVQASLDGQDILIQHTDTGHRLARLLQPEAARTVLRGHTVFWRVSHDREIDALLVELIDLFISIRYAHPALVQLELALSEGEEAIPESAEP